MIWTKSNGDHDQQSRDGKFVARTMPVPPTTIHSSLMIWFQPTAGLLLWWSPERSSSNFLEIIHLECSLFSLKRPRLIYLSSHKFPLFIFCTRRRRVFPFVIVMIIGCGVAVRHSISSESTNGITSLLQEAKCSRFSSGWSATKAKAAHAMISHV